MDETRHGSPIVEKAAHLLDAVADSSAGVSLGELVTRLGLPRSTVYRILNSLAAHGLVAKVNGGSAYQLGPRFIELARTISPAADRARLVEVAQPIMESISESLREASKLSVPEGDEMMAISGVGAPGEYTIAFRVGSRSPKHVGAAGKLALAFAGDEAVAAYCAHGLAARTQYTITDPHLLKEALRRIRREGFAIDNMESGAGIHALAAPIFDAAGEVTAALSVPFLGEPTPDRTDVIRRVVMDGAAAITHAIGGAAASKYEP